MPEPRGATVALLLRQEPRPAAPCGL